MTTRSLPPVESPAAWDLVLDWVIDELHHGLDEQLRQAVRTEPKWRALYRAALRYLVGDRTVTGEGVAPIAVTQAPKGLSAFASAVCSVRLPHRGPRACLVVREEAGEVVARAGSAEARAPMSEGRVTLEVDAIAGEVVVSFEVVEPDFDAAIEIVARALTDGDPVSVGLAAVAYADLARPVLRSAALRVAAPPIASESEDDGEEEAELVDQVARLLYVRLEVEADAETLDDDGKEAMRALDATLWEERRGVLIVAPDDYYDVLRENGWAPPARRTWWAYRALIEERMRPDRLEHLLLTEPLGSLHDGDGSRAARALAAGDTSTFTHLDELLSRVLANAETARVTPRLRTLEASAGAGAAMHPATRSWTLHPAEAPASNPVGEAWLEGKAGDPSALVVKVRAPDIDSQVAVVVLLGLARPAADLPGRVRFAVFPRRELSDRVPLDLLLIDDAGNAYVGLAAPGRGTGGTDHD